MTQKMTLIHHPTVALKILGFSGAFEQFAETGVYLGNVYRRIMPPSLPRVASVIERHTDAEVDILDLRLADSEREEVTSVIDWEGYDVEVRRVGAALDAMDAAVQASDWVGFSSHFTFESGVIRDLIAHAKRVKPSVRVMVGGADAKARPSDYLAFGADYVAAGDFDPTAFREFDGSPLVSTQRHPFEDLTRPAFGKLPDLSAYTDSHDGAVPDGVTTPIGFLYFTRGCPRECDFCETRRTKFETLDLEHALQMIDHYAASGIRTLNFADDNLLMAAATPAGRVKVFEIFRALRERGFAWEFPNGLEVGRFLEKDGSIDEAMLTAMLTHEVRDDRRIVGAYRLYVPLETFDARERYKKLKPLIDQKRVIQWLAATGLPEINFGVVIPPNATADTYLHIRDGYADLKETVQAAGDIRARYAAFHLIPISLYRGMATKYTVDQFPEGWNFYFPIYDGQNMSARELFERRLELVREIDPSNYESMARGEYSYA
jgi:hypothetical protein